MSWLEGKSVLVTGAGGGIGRAACVAFARHGATVLGLDLNDDWLSGVGRDLGSSAGGVRAVVGDVTDTKGVAAAVEELADWTGSVDIVVAGAGIQAVGSTEDTSEETWRRVIDINLTGSWLTCKHAIPAMRAGGGGTILCLASTAGLHPRANLAAYCVSKAGVAMLVRVMGREVTAEGIRVVGVCPTGVETPLLQEMIDGLTERAGAQGSDAGLLKGKPVQRWLKPDEVAEALVWLTSPAAGMVSGSNIPLDFGSA